MNYREPPAGKSATGLDRKRTKASRQQTRAGRVEMSAFTRLEQANERSAVGLVDRLGYNLDHGPRQGLSYYGRR